MFKEEPKYDEQRGRCIYARARFLLYEYADMGE